MNDKPFTLDLNTFCSSTCLDYHKSKYVDHTVHEAIKTKLGKIATNASYLDKTLILKNSFHVAWRILFTFVIQPTEDSEQSHPVSSGTVPDPQGLERNIQLAGMGLPSTLAEGTRKSEPLLEGKKYNLKDSVGNKHPIDTGLPFMESDEEEVFATGDDIEDDTQADEKQHQSPSPNKDKPEPSHTPKTKVSDSDSSSPILKKYDNIPSLTER
nr:hypothetical protein [Tanacetum cinerariifolium]